VQVKVVLRINKFSKKEPAECLRVREETRASHELFLKGALIMSTSENSRILLVGSTGTLGTELTKAIAARGDLTLRVLLRSAHPNVVDQLTGRGIEVVAGDVMNPDSLPPAMQGVEIVLSALPNVPQVFVEGHRNLIAAADDAGVRRFVPSDFSVDYFKIGADENFNLAMRKQVVPLFEGRRIRPMHILIGAFMDTMLDPRSPFIDWQRSELPYFGDGLQQCDFTSIADAARYVAAACADPVAPEVLRFAGDVLTMPQFAASVSRAYGRCINPISWGSVTDLAALIADKQRTAVDPWEWIALQYHHNMVSGRAKLDPLDNERYPEIRPETVEDFARRSGEGKARGMSKSAVA
jgi:nucleoside-diphosphate-sugar epimerase